VINRLDIYDAKLSKNLINVSLHTIDGRDYACQRNTPLNLKKWFYLLNL